MANPAINAAIMAAAASQAQGEKQLRDQLIKAGATSARAAAPLNLSVEGSDKLLANLIRQGHVRDMGGGRYWLDEKAIKDSKAAATRAAFILLAFLASALASVVALTAAF